METNYTALLAIVKFFVAIFWDKLGPLAGTAYPASVRPWADLPSLSMKASAVKTFSYNKLIFGPLIL
ncbi:hypothetical protein SAMN05216386_0708 [Nitrosospira briensis]|uniref:Uncharacterized protein n=1 Tax=Nitrosospira briensis TaxID=35799 RepID=A0A1I4YHS5_9PROT|nr:hypothetical protein [Nitrosospira briensis]SFN37604.1 hypothetical protein SAMN05216386_0708 [Nitrosospira briensis]